MCLVLTLGYLDTIVYFLNCGLIAPFGTSYGDIIMTTLTLDKPVGELARETPGLGRLFDQLGIDFCCAGRKTLRDACNARGLDVHTVAALLATAPLAPAQCPDPRTMTLASLVNHIVSTHHAYTREELPRLSQWINKVAAVHGDKDGRLVELSAIFLEFRADLAEHMVKEEHVLFPMIVQMEQSGTVPMPHCGSIENPIHVMEAEHENAGHALARMRELTDGYTPPADACNTYCTMLDALIKLERDMHQHVHEENNVLFPRASELHIHLMRDSITQDVKI